MKIASLAVLIFQLWKYESGLETGTIQTESQESSYGWCKTSPFNHGKIFRTLPNEHYNASFTSDGHKCHKKYTANATKSIPQKVYHKCHKKYTSVYISEDNLMFVYLQYYVLIVFVCKLQITQGTVHLFIWRSLGKWLTFSYIFDKVLPVMKGVKSFLFLSQGCYLCEPNK